MQGLGNRCAPTRTRVARGFTLVEMLFAIVILLIGVVMALRIFPRGFAAYLEDRQQDAAMKYANLTLQSLLNDPNGMPEAILPLDESYSPSGREAAEFTADLSAIEYMANGQNSSSVYVWYSKHLYPLGGIATDWPAWQPASTRVLRRVVGERCIIPAEMSKDSSNITLAFTQKYLPRFSPIMPMGAWNTSTSQYSQEPVLIYDLRYRRLPLVELTAKASTPENLPDSLYYTIDYDTHTLSLLPVAQSRTIRLSFMYLDGALHLHQYMPAEITVDAAPSGSTDLVEVDLAGVPSSPFSDPQVKLLSGSEQLNRAYRYVADRTALASGEYSFEHTNTLLLGAIYFAPADAGRPVKLDYNVADWGILHEDLTVDPSGYLQLSVPDPKIRNKPAYPREPATWGIYRPMRSDGTDVVMALVDTRNGQAYHIFNDEKHTITDYRPQPEARWRARQDFKIVPVQYIYPQWATTDVPLAPNQPRLIEMKDAARGLVRVGVGSVAAPNWSALSGQTFRVFYRARRDWCIQVYRAPAVFWYQSPQTLLADTELGWNRFSQQGASIAVPGVYAGQTLAVDYVYAGSPYQRVTGEQHVVPPPATGKKVSIIPLQNDPAEGTNVAVRGLSVTVRAMWIQPRSGKAYTYSGPAQPAQSTLNERWAAKAVTTLVPEGP